MLLATALLGAAFSGLLDGASSGAALQDPDRSSATDPTPGLDDPAEVHARLTEGQTRLRVLRYERTEGWALRGLVLLSLGPDWHPLGAAIVLDALRSDSRELRLFAIEALIRTEPEALRRVITAEIVDAIVERDLEDEDLAWRLHASRVLRAAFPGVRGTSPDAWRARWRELGETYEREPWTPPEIDPDGRSVAASAVDRAFDLEKAGLEIVLCIDTTGSMQGAVNAAAAACEDLVRVLASFSPKVRVGLVHYREIGDLEGGANRLLDLTDDHRRLRGKLRALRCDGGGDFPERVEKGLALALDERKIDWTWGANKLVVVVGDAPPHDETLGDLLQLARETSRKSRGRGDASSMKRSKDGRSAVPRGRPATISCIGVGNAGVDERTTAAFKALARAGGGTYVPLVLGSTTASGDSPSDRILEHVLRFSFGESAGGELEMFVEVLLRGRRRGWLR